MEPFGNHLSSDQHIGFSCTKLFEQFVMATFMARCIGIEADGSDLRKDSVQRSVRTCSVPAPLNLKQSTAWQPGTLGRDRKEFVIAEGGKKDVFPFVKGQTDRTVRTVEDMSADTAGCGSMESSSIEKDQ
jgi:hypothetical protein